MTSPKPLAARLGVAAWGIPLIILVVYLGGWIFSLFIALVAAIALFEFYAMAETRHLNPQTFPAVFLAFAAVFISAFLDAGTWMTLMFLLAIVLAFIEIQFGERQGLRDLPATLFGWAYIPLLLGTLVFVRHASWPNPETSTLFTLYFLSAIWICDTAAYAGGKTLGRHKMSPYVSPKKTWEGALSGLLGAILWAVLWGHFLADRITDWDLFYIAFVVAIIGQLGDLIESYFKRSAGLKDSGNLLGEHGGALDRFDSLILSAPFVFIYQVAMGRITLS